MLHLFRRTRNALVLGLALLVIGVSEAGESQSGATPPRIDVESLGPKVGASLPEFTLRDQGGVPHSLKSMLGPKGAVIVFFRSADW